MRHLFVVNPKAGKGQDVESFRSQLESKLDQLGIDYDIHVTTAAGDGIEYVKNETAKGDPVRFYACGGDGTLYEVVNGCAEKDNAEIAALPLGGGNDFIRLFGKKENLLNVEDHVNGTPFELDLIKCCGRYAINQCSMGLDAEVCAKQASFKKVPFISGEGAYMASLFYCFIGKMKSEFTIQIDDDPPFTQEVLFCLGANSRWYGGGFMGAPKAIPYDGLLDFIIVKKDCSRAKLLGLINDYKAGNHLEWERTLFQRGKKIHVTSEKLAAVNIDGECEYVHESTFEIVPKGCRFVVPACSDFLERVKKGSLETVGV